LTALQPGWVSNIPLSVKVQSNMEDTKHKLDPNEAPCGFHAVLKADFKIPNACDACDARKLCQDNTDDWCLKNRCMSYEIIAFKDGKTYSRNDKQSVLFKRKV